MKPEKQTRNHRLATITLALVAVLFTVGCGEFYGGIIWEIEGPVAGLSAHACLGRYQIT